MVFTFMLPCVLIDFFLNNQSDALIIQTYSVITLYMFRASSLPIIRSSILYIRHCYVSCKFLDDRFQAESGWNRSSILTLLGNGHQKNLHETSQYRMYGREHLMMGREDARNM